jgi:hypothetical protein
MPANGAFTTDQVALQQLYTEFQDGVSEAAAAGNAFLRQFCTETKKKTVRVRQRTVTAQHLGSDTTVPDMNRKDYVEFDLAEPERWGLKSAVTREAVDRGIDSSEIRSEHQEMMDGMDRLLAETVLQSMLINGGFWDGAMAAVPPAYKKNTFLVTHDHYLARAGAGVPLLSDFTRLKRTITEHGYGRDFVGLINGDTAEQIENKAEWATAPGPMTTPVMAKLQDLGVTPGLNAAGLPVVVEDWIPSGYVLVASLQIKPCYWRNPENHGSEIDTELDTTQRGQYSWISEYFRYTSCRVVHRGAGAALYLGGAAWVDPTFNA